MDDDWGASSSNYNISDFDFVSEPPKDEFKTVVNVCETVAAILGIVANALVLVLSSCHVNGDFRHFVANLAIVDILCGMLFAFMGYLNIGKNYELISPSLMNMAALAYYGSFGVMICALVPISISRIFALTKPKIYHMLFAGHQSLIFCFAFDLLPIFVLYSICIVDDDVKKVLFYLYAAITVAAYLIAFFSNYMVFRIVANHIRIVQNLRDQARLLETRQVALATLAQALVPLVCQVPSFLSLASVMLIRQSVMLDSSSIMTDKMIAVTNLWLASSPLLDAIITVLVIKQYRKQTFRCFSSSVNRMSWHNIHKSGTLFSDEKEALETKL